MTITTIKKRKGRKTSPSIVILIDHIHNKLINDYPISLAQFNKNYFIDIQISSIRTIFDESSEIILCCGFSADTIADHVKKKYRGQNIKIVENKLYEEKSGVEGLRLCLNNINNESLLVVDGHLLIYPEIFSKFDPINFVMLQKKEFVNLEIGLIKDGNNTITNLSYGLPDKWAEIFHVNNYEDMEKLRTTCSMENAGNKMLFEILNESGIKFTSIDNEFPLVKIIDSKTKNKVKRIYESADTGLFVKFI
jgi:hypothetical protein